MAGQYEVTVGIGARFRERVDADWMRRVVGRVLAAENAASCAVGLVVTGDRAIRDLNRRYGGEDAPTDVLSFSFVEAGEDFVVPPDRLPHLGDVVVSLPAARRQARAFGESLERTLERLVVHGVLHLVGYDHERVEDGGAMKEREDALLADDE